MKYAYGLPQQIIGIIFAGQQAAISDLIEKTKKPLAIKDILSEERFRHWILQEYGVRSVLGVPLLVREEVIGILYFSYFSVKPDFSRPEIDFAEKLSASVSLAIQNSHLYEEIKQTEKELARSNAELEQLNAELDAERARWKGVVEGIADEVWFCDVEGKMSLMNLTTVTAMGLEEFKGKSVNEVLDEVDILNPDGQMRPPEQAPLLRSLRGEIVRGEEIMRHRRTGRIRVRQFSSAPTRDASGKIMGAVAIVRDITEQKQMEEKLKKLTAELARSNAELEQFAYIASHDLQEPLRMVSGFTQLLARRYKGKLDKDADEFIAYIVDGAKRMQSMIEDLLTYSRVGTRGKPFEPTNLETILDQVMINLKVAIEENKAVITHDPLPTVMADPTQMVQLFQNLIGNAIKFRKKEMQPRIHILAQQKGNEWLISVKDNGIGIAPEFMSHLFQLFQRAATEYPGTGIGLALCKRIVERHGGRIWAESEPGKGSTFYFTIPVKK